MIDDFKEAIEEDHKPGRDTNLGPWRTGESGTGNGNRTRIGCKSRRDQPPMIH